MSSSSTLLVPDNDADGLTGGLIVYRTLVFLGHKPENIRVHFVSKGANPHQELERERLATYGAQYAVIVSQGSRAGPILVPSAKNLLLDHHYSDEFPKDTLVSCSRIFLAFGALDAAYIRCFRPVSTNLLRLSLVWHTSFADHCTQPYQPHATICAQWALSGI